jgi:hypothetical protein
MTKVTVCDPPSGWKYGFPKPLPEGVTEIIPWLVSEGYPQSEIDACGIHFFVRYWEKETEND